MRGRILSLLAERGRLSSEIIVSEYGPEYGPGGASFRYVNAVIRRLLSEGVIVADGPGQFIKAGPPAKSENQNLLF